MAEFSKQTVLTFMTDEDLEHSAYRCVLLGADENMGITTSAVIPPTGITTDNVSDGSSTASAVSVAIAGVVKAEAGAAINAGVAVIASGNGKVIGGSPGNVAIGIALSPALADGDIITVLIDRYEVT